MTMSPIYHFKRTREAIVERLAYFKSKAIECHIENGKRFNYYLKKIDQYEYKLEAIDRRIQVAESSMYYQNASACGSESGD